MVWRLQALATSLNRMHLRLQAEQNVKQAGRNTDADVDDMPALQPVRWAVL
jgi:hypothetical protein